MKSRNDDVCVICGTDRNVQDNHAGGRNHIAWLKPPFCKPHHDQYHRLLESVGVDLQYTPNKLKRLMRAALAMTIALWIVLQALAEGVSELHEKK